jgi:general L-amino acid transport system substrate-binding protein
VILLKTANRFGKLVPKIQSPRKSWQANFVLGLVCLLAITACEAESPSSINPADGTTTPQPASRLNAIRQRGQLTCGVSGELPGFSYIDPDGNYAGIDVEICRAIAAAVFDDPDAVEYRNLNAKDRFTAVQSGEVDVLSRNTTWSLSRATTVGLAFGPVVFYDSQGVMVRKSSGIQSLEGLKNRSICTQTGTTNEQNMTDQMRQRGIPFKPLVFEDINTAYSTYAGGRCDAVTSDRSQLISRLSKFPRPEEHTILNAVLSKEPLAPAVAAGDQRLASVLQWTVFALIEAEELGIQKQNVTQFLKSSDPVVKRFLGVEGELGKGLGLTNDFAVRIIKHVGNYGEIYDRNLGPKTLFKLPRGQNNLWTKGGLMVSPPFR